MILSDRDIITALASGEITISPFREEMLKPGSYVLTLGDIVYRPKDSGVIDARDPKIEYEEIKIFPQTGYVLNPGDFILAQTFEAISVSKSIAATSDTRSTIARLGLQVILSSSYIEPGQTRSHETLEIAHHGHSPVQLFPFMPIVKAIFYQLKSPASSGYSEHGSYAFQNKPYPRG